MSLINKFKDAVIFSGEASKKKKKQTKERTGRIRGKNMHVTIHNLPTPDFQTWLDKGQSFRKNVNAVLVGMEENHEEGKGVHAHIALQFTTRQDLTREQFVKHFQSESIHISTMSSRSDLLNVLGYISKTGQTKQWGKFKERGQELEADPEIYRFQYQVKSTMDASKYFRQVIEENLGKEKDIIDKMINRENSIADYLITHTSLTDQLRKKAKTKWLEWVNSKKPKLMFYDWMDDKAELTKHYVAYLKEYPQIFKENLKLYKKTRLEPDYDKHVEHDVERITEIYGFLNQVIKYGSERGIKESNLFIWSKAPSFGKSRLIDALEARLKCYALPEDQYYVKYENHHYELLVSDEAEAFIKTKDYSHLKKIFEGRRVEFNQKGKEKVTKQDNPLIIMTDNRSFYDIMEQHHKRSYQGQREILEDRVLDIEIKSRATLHFFVDRGIKSEKKETGGV